MAAKSGRDKVKDRVRQRSAVVVDEHYAAVPPAFEGKGDEVNVASRVYGSMFDPRAGERIPPSLAHRTHAMRNALPNKDPRRKLSSLGASEGIVDASSRPDPSHHNRYEDRPCSPELLRDVMAIADTDPDRTTPAPAVRSSPLLRMTDLARIKDAISGGMQDPHISKLVGKVRGGGEGEGEGEVDLGRLFLRVSVDSDGRLSRQVTALPFSKFQVEEVLWRRGLESGRFMYEPPAEWVPSALQQKRRDGTMAPPTLVVLGNRFRALVRLGSGSKLLWRRIKGLPRPQQEDFRARVTMLSKILTALARALFDMKAGRGAEGQEEVDEEVDEEMVATLPRRFGGKRMAQIYNKFIKSPINVLRGAMNVGRYQRTLPDTLFSREMRRNPEFMAEVQKMQAGKRKMVRLRREAPTVHNPSGIRIEFDGLRNMLDRKMGREHKILQTGPTNAFVGRNFGMTPHRAVDRQCLDELAGPGVSTGVDPLTKRLLMLRSRKGGGKRYWACERGVRGSAGNRLQLATVSDDRLRIQETLRLAKEYKPSGSGSPANSTPAQARTMQRVILSSPTWPIARQFRETARGAGLRETARGGRGAGGQAVVNYRAWTRAQDFDDLPLTLEDEMRSGGGNGAAGNIDVDDEDGGVLAGYVDVIMGLFGGESLVADDFDMEVLTLLIHRAALRRRVYVWRSFEDKQWAAKFGADEHLQVEDFVNWTDPSSPAEPSSSYSSSSSSPAEPSSSSSSTTARDTMREWLGEFGKEGSVTRYSVGSWKGGRLQPLALIRIRHSRESLRVQNAAIRVQPTTPIARAIRSVSPAAAQAMVRFSNRPFPRYMLADQIRELNVVSGRPGSAGNWIGAVVAMMSYVSSKKSRIGTRSWISHLTTLPHSRMSFAIHQVLWFQPLGTNFESGGAPTSAQHPSSSTVAYRPPMLAMEASLILWTLIQKPRGRDSQRREREVV